MPSNMTPMDAAKPSVGQVWFKNTVQMWTHVNWTKVQFKVQDITEPNWKSGSVFATFRKVQTAERRVQDWAKFQEKVTCSRSLLVFVHPLVYFLYSRHFLTCIWACVLCLIPLWTLQRMEVSHNIIMSECRLPSHCLNMNSRGSDDPQPVQLRIKGHYQWPWTSWCLQRFKPEPDASPVELEVQFKVQVREFLNRMPSPVLCSG